ncbi:MAG: nucleotide exchange factor GrpE [Bacteroidales bacterium]|nr:nucleotide exchange factor GrpE [Bacteroidales bacterium]
MKLKHHKHHKRINKQNKQTMTQDKDKETQQVDVENVEKEPTTEEGTQVETPAEVDWEQKYNELNDTYLRLYADFENYRRKAIKEKADLLKSASKDVLVNILPIVDNFERALQTIEKATDVKAVGEGVNLIYQQVLTFLKQNGVEPIVTDDQAFDTELHEAITTIPVEDDNKKGKVIDCVQKGYKLYDKVIRYSKVVVGK